MSGTSSASPEDLQVFVKSAGTPRTGWIRASPPPRGPSTRSTTHLATRGSDRRAARRGSGRPRPWWRMTALTKGGSPVSARRSSPPTPTRCPTRRSRPRCRRRGSARPRPSQLTVDEPVYQGAVMYSGWTDDPVSTGTGHFLEREEDLAMPDALAVLRWTRTYSSRFVADQCNGRGWHSWADVRLDVQPAIVTYHGPDGQVSAFARADDRLGPPSGHGSRASGRRRGVRAGMAVDRTVPWHALDVRRRRSPAEDRGSLRRGDHHRARRRSPGGARSRRRPEARRGCGRTAW